MLTRQQDAVLRLLSERPGQTAALAELDGLKDVRRPHTVVRNLIGKLLVQRDFNWVDGETYLSLTEAGRIARTIAVERPPCHWCGERAVEGQRLRSAKRLVIYYCEDHLDHGREAAENHVLSTKGSLYGLIRTGRIKPRQPDEVAA